jgi:hypothetical protein
MNIEEINLGTEEIVAIIIIFVAFVIWVWRTK